MRWIVSYVTMHKHHEQMRTPWAQRLKNSRALRARIEEQDDRGPVRTLKRWVRGYN